MKRMSALRSALARKPVRLWLAAVITAAMVPAAMLATSSAASATSTSTRCGHIVETFGRYAIGAPSLDLEKPVMETTDGRVLDCLSSSNGMKLAFEASPTHCVAAANDGHDVVIHLCSGDGTVWEFRENSVCPASFCFENHRFSGMYLSGDGHGDQFQIKNANAAGWLQTFTQTT